MRAVIIGGGVGGLTAALSLAQSGHSVRVLEQAEALTGIGGGLQIAPNAARILLALGLERALDAVCVRPDRIEMRYGRTGAPVFSTPLQSAALGRWGAPYLHGHRADLVAVLQAALEAVAPGALRLGAQVVGYDGAAAVLADGSREAGDILIAADGNRSRIRAQMLGAAEPAPRFTGAAAWRAVIPVEAMGDLAPPPNAVVWVGRGRHAVTTRVCGGRMVNFVGVVAQSDWRDEDWRTEGAREQALADFAGWAPTIMRAIDCAPAYHRWALFDRAPLPRWSDGAAGLIGDAAHPMSPSFAQGAAQAIEDAWALSETLKAGAAPAEAWRRLFAARIDRTARIQRASRDNARLFHGKALPSAFGFWPVAIAARLAPGLMNARLDWVYGHKAGAA